MIKKSTIRPTPALPDDEKTDPGVAYFPTPAPRPRVMPDLGALNPFFSDPSITEVMVNDLRNVIIERNGVMEFTGFTYKKLEDLNSVVGKLCEVSGRQLTEEQPFLDSTLPDGSRVHIVTQPLTLNGPCITIRKFPSQRLTMEDLVAKQTLDSRMAQFLGACAASRMNLLICGGTGSGKTSLLNALTGSIRKGERLVTIEDTPELSIAHFNSVRLQTRPHAFDLPAISARDLVAHALRMRPDRIIVGECRRGEAFDMLQAMNTGHLGSMTTIHANSPRDSLARLESLCMLAGLDLPLLAIRRQIQGALDLIVQIRRMRDGHRRVSAITEVTGMEGEVITLQDIFLLEKEDPLTFKCTGFVPTFLDRMAEQGITVPKDFFS